MKDRDGGQASGLAAEGGKGKVSTGQIATGTVSDRWEPPAGVAYPESSFTPLFGGRTIAGPMKDMSNCTPQSYSNFALRFEFRLLSHKKQPWTGVRLRHGGSSRRLSVVLSEEMCGGLLLDQSLLDVKKPLIEESLDEIHRVIKPALNVEKPFGEWNRCEVVCEGPRTTVAINDRVVNHITNGPSGTGMICLAGSEGDGAFRKVRVMELSEPSGFAVSQPGKRGNLAPSLDHPTVLQWKMNDYKGSKDDYARVEDGVVRVGMGQGGDFGIGEVGVEVDGASRVKAEVRSVGAFRKFDGNSMSGFIIDYHTSEGYSKRVAVYLGQGIKGRYSVNPFWGKGSLPDASLAMQTASTYDIDLKRWAPAEWDGRVWFSIVLQNTGRNTGLTAKLDFEK